MAWGTPVPLHLKIVEPEDPDSVLPPGRRDRSGFWYPLGCTDLRTLVKRRARGDRKKPPATPDRSQENGEH